MSEADDKRATDDGQWWAEWGEPLGLTLIGWTFRHQARFVDRESGQTINVAQYRGPYGGDGNFAFLDRLRKRLTKEPTT